MSNQTTGKSSDKRFTKEELEALFKQALWETDRKKFDKLDFNSRFTDLGLDSVLMFEVVGYMEERLGILFPDEKLAELNSLQELYDLANSLPPQKR